MKKFSYFSVKTILRDQHEQLAMTVLTNVALTEKIDVLFFRLIGKSFEVRKSKRSDLKSFLVMALEKSLSMTNRFFFLFKFTEEIRLGRKLRDILVDPILFEAPWIGSHGYNKIAFVASEFRMTNLRNAGLIKQE